MSEPIAIIHWTTDQKLSTSGPRVAHIFAVSDLRGANVFALKSAIIIPLVNGVDRELAMACEELARSTCADSVSLSVETTSRTWGFQK